jgi:protein-tyrosine-phosphatase
MTWDVTDPYGRGRAAARRAADEIDEALGVILAATAGRLV